MKADGKVGLLAQDSSNNMIGLSNGLVSVNNGSFMCSFSKNNTYNPQGLSFDKLYMIIAYGSGREMAYALIF